MKISPITNYNRNNKTNPNFQALKVSNRALKGLGCSKDDILKNDFIRTLANDADVSITSQDGSIFKKATNFVFEIGKPLLEFSSPFKTLDELFEKIDSIKEDYYFKNAIKKYPVEYKIFQSLEKEENISEFIDQMDYLMPSIASIPNTPQYKKLNDYFLSVLQKMRFWRPLPKSHRALPKTNKKYWAKAKIDTTESTGLRALKNNNLGLLKFLREKNENLNQCLDYIKTNPVSDEVKEVLKDVKYQDAKIFELEDLISNSKLVEKFFEENPNIDINSRNSKGDTLAHQAIKHGNLYMLRYLMQRDDVDWNSYDKDGHNILMCAVFKNDSFVTKKLTKLPGEKLDLKKCCILEDSYNTDISKVVNPITFSLELYDMNFYPDGLDLLYMKNLDVMYQCNPNDLPLVLEAMKRELPAVIIKIMLDHDSFDSSQKLSDGKNIYEWICSNPPRSFLGYTKFIPMMIIKEAKKLYDKNGELTLQQINTFLDAMLENNINYWLLDKQPSFNVLGDNIGHLLCDTYFDILDGQKMEELEMVINKLIKYRYNFFQENEIGQTPLSRAIEGKNQGLIQLLTKVQNRMF